MCMWVQVPSEARGIGSIWSWSYRWLRADWHGDCELSSGPLEKRHAALYHWAISAFWLLTTQFVLVCMIQGRFYATSDSNPFWILVAWGQKIDTEYPASCSRAAEDSTNIAEEGGGSSAPLFWPTFSLSYAPRFFPSFGDRVSLHSPGVLELTV